MIGTSIWAKLWEAHTHINLKNNGTYLIRTILLYIQAKIRVRCGKMW